MIQELSWYTKSTGNTFFSDIHFRVHYGRSYQLSYNGSGGYVIYAGQAKRNEKMAHAMLGDTQLFLKNEGSSFRSTFNIYDYKTNECIGKLNRLGFMLLGIQYTLRQTKKSIFLNKHLPCDLRFEVNGMFPDTMVRMDIDRSDKKWYKDVYQHELKGLVKFQQTIPKEIVLSTFFFLQDEIEAHTRD